jgi:hypothetical protein
MALTKEQILATVEPATVKLIQFYNSWGAIGDNGKQYFSEEYINSGFIYDCFTVTKHVFNTDLKLGMVSNEVKYLQVKLGILPTTFGFGVFGPKTLAAVKAYQLVNKITPVSGYVGPLTRAKLNS